MKITEMTTNTFWKGELGVKSIVEDEGSSHKVSLYIKGSQIRDYSCSCVHGNSYKGMCSHAGYVWQEWQQQRTRNSGRSVSTSQEVRSMIQEYTNREVARIIREGEEEPVFLVPRLQIRRQEINLEFKIGRERFYLLKDLCAFTEAMGQGALIEYGKQLAFHHSIQAFAPADQELVVLLMELADSYQQHYDQFRKRSFITIPVLKQLTLSRMNRDRFLQLMEGRRIELEDAKGIGRLVLVVRKNPELLITIESAGKDGLRVFLEDGLFSFRGERYLYVCSREHLYCLDRAASESLDIFLNWIQKRTDGAYSVEIQERDMPLFYERVLQQILPYSRLEVKDVDLESYRPQELRAKFLFDSSKPGELTMIPELSYGSYSFHPVEDEKVPRTICRDVPGEFRISQLITKYFKYRQEGSRSLIIRDDDDALYHLLTDGMAEFSEMGEIYLTDSAQKFRVSAPPQVSVGIRTMDNWLELTIDAGDISSSELTKILSEYQQKKPYYRLKNGEFLQLTDHGLMTLARLTDGMDIHKTKIQNHEIKIPMYRALYLDSVLKDGAGITLYRDQLFKSVVRGMKSVEDSDFEIPKSLLDTLRSYQKTGYRWLRTLDRYGFGGILADDMGLGKTIQMITVLLAWQQANQGQQAISLIVCPASLVYNWENELNRFAPELKIRAITAAAAEREQQINEWASYDVFITSYDLLKRDIEHYQKISFRYQVIDEAQYIKNPGTQSARAVKQINAQTRFALTGTPIENRLSELWSIFDYLMPGFLYGYQKFKTQYEIPIIKDQSQEAMENLRRMIGPFILRRLKADVLKELPGKIESVIYSRSEGRQKDLYTAQALQLKQQLEAMEGAQYQTGKLQILAQLMRLRQLCCDPSLCYQNYQGGSAKLDTCMELLVSAIEGGHKILLFSQFTSMLSIIEQRLKKQGISYYLLTGSTSKEERIRMVGSFAQDEVSVFLISLKAGGTGLNLTAADIVIHYDPWWNVAAQNQATDRTHRIGQERQVSVFQLIMKDTIEENMLRLQESKKYLAEQIITEGTISLSSLTKEDLLVMLE
ncbi:MAG: DEAD/DEAH box helicase [Lachnospiraceae bacterium]